MVSKASHADALPERADDGGRRLYRAQEQFYHQYSLHHNLYRSGFNGGLRDGPVQDRGQELFILGPLTAYASAYSNHISGISRDAFLPLGGHIPVHDTGVYRGKSAVRHLDAAELLPGGSDRSRGERPH